MGFFFLLAKCKFLITDALASKTRGPREIKQKDREMKTRAGKISFCPLAPTPSLKDSSSASYEEILFFRLAFFTRFALFTKFHRLSLQAKHIEAARKIKQKKERKSSEMKKTNFLHELSHRVEHRGMYVFFMAALC